MKENVVIATQNRIRELKEKKAAELEHIDNELNQAIIEFEEANKAMQAAMEATDIEAYGETKRKQLEAKNKKEMYSGRYKQLKACEYLTEKESDEVIDNILAYEGEIAGAYEEELKKILDDLKAVHEKYIADAQDAENTIRTWTTQIHANYQSRGSASYVDDFTGERTDRSPHPIGVKQTRSRKSEIVTTFLEKMDA